MSTDLGWPFMQRGPTVWIYIFVLVLREFGRSVFSLHRTFGLNLNLCLWEWTVSISRLVFFLFFFKQDLKCCSMQCIGHLEQYNNLKDHVKCYYTQSILFLLKGYLAYQFICRGYTSSLLGARQYLLTTPGIKPRTISPFSQNLEL